MKGRFNGRSITCVGVHINLATETLELSKRPAIVRRSLFWSSRRAIRPGSRITDVSSAFFQLLKGRLTDQLNLVVFSSIVFCVIAVAAVGCIISAAVQTIIAVVAMKIVGS